MKRLQIMTFAASIALCGFLVGCGGGSSDETAESLPSDVTLYEDADSTEALVATSQAIGASYRDPYGFSADTSSLMAKNIRYLPGEDCTCDPSESTFSCLYNLHATCIEEYEPTDTDGDGTPDTEDTDDDNDGTPDTEDTDDDGDGIPDDEEGYGGGGSEGGPSDPDTDGDGTPDSEDTDDDDDGNPDTDDTDDDGDGDIDPDTDGDRTPDNEDTDDDNDGSPDTEDTDDDGDGTPDDQEDDSRSSEHGGGYPSGGSSTGDPHLTTFDGLKFDSQARGVFWLVQDAEGQFSVQAIQQFVDEGTSLAENAAVAVNAFGHTLAFYAAEGNMTLDGNPLTLVDGGMIAWDGAVLLRNASGFLIATSENQLFYVNFEDMGLSPTIIIPRERDRYTGILGNVNGNPYDDLSTDDGDSTVDELGTLGAAYLTSFVSSGSLVYRLAADELYDEFISNFVVEESASYFAGPAYVSYLKPTTAVTLSDFSDSEIESARQACIAASGLPDGQASLFDCVYDFLTAGVAVEDSASPMERQANIPMPQAWIETE